MKKCLLFFLVILCVPEAFAQKPFDREGERAKMLSVLDNIPEQNLQVLNASQVSPQAEVFLAFFQKEVWPILTQVTKLGVKSSLLHTAADRALYNDEEEKQKWANEETKANNEMQKVSTSSAWQETMKKWSELSTGLQGELPEFARRMRKDAELADFSEKELPLLNRLTEIEIKISDIANSSPLVPKLGDTEKATNDVIANYFSKKISFDEAWKKIESYSNSGRNALAQDVATKGQALFQEAAIIRTKLAESKGYKNWADYSIATQARNYKAPFNTADGLVQFLQKILDETLPVYKEFLEKQYSAIPGTDPNNRRMSQSALLDVEAESLIRDYFPKENIEDVWSKTMLESGFDPQKLTTISLDGYPRENKYTHAYMNNISSHEPKTLVIDSSTLNAVGGDSASWFNSLIYIVQNYRDDGALAWTTAFHEGGHAMDYSHREDLFGNGAAYGYTETHSMTMERFFEDPEFLINTGKTRDGKPLSKKLAQEYIINSKINALKSLRTQVSNALYDILLWRENYSEKGQDFVTFAKKLRRKWVENATQLKTVTVEGIDPAYGGFATNHFYSGSVRYFGYILADVAAEMSAEKLWDTFEEKTGRRTFYKQSEMAKTLIDGYYKNGFLSEFPQSIENFTGKTYSPDAIVAASVKALNQYKPEGFMSPECSKELSALKKPKD